MHYMNLQPRQPNIGKNLQYLLNNNLKIGNLEIVKADKICIK